MSDLVNYLKIEPKDMGEEGYEEAEDFKARPDGATMKKQDK
jgi:hypothetical protein